MIDALRNVLTKKKSAIFKASDSVTESSATKTGDLPTIITGTPVIKASDSDTVESSDTKTRDLQAFRTIITMLKYFQTANGRLSAGETGIISIRDDDNKQLEMLDALSTLLVRQMEIVAVLAHPYDGQEVDVVVSTANNGSAESSGQPGVESMWTRALSFTASLNPRTSRINKHNDSLINKTRLPTITDCGSVPNDLALAAKDGGGSLLQIFLSNHWGKESFDTHAWMLKTLLERLQTDSASSQPGQRSCKEFRLYTIATSYRRSHTRMENVAVSVPYISCLENLPSSVFSNLAIAGRTANKTRGNRDTSFAKAIVSIGTSEAFKTKFPNLLVAASDDTAEMYNENTYLEFHLLLCELLLLFKCTLDKLIVAKKKVDEKKVELKVALDALDHVLYIGGYLRPVARSSVVETHFRTIEKFLEVDSQKSWTPQLDSDLQDEDELDDVEDFQKFKPHSLRKGIPLAPWQSYRDWLLLMVHYFDAANTLITSITNLRCPPISITILTPPLPDASMTMLPWTDLLKNERYFPTILGESSGSDFIDVLKTNTVKVEVEKAQQIVTDLKSDMELNEFIAKVEQLAKVVRSSTSVECEYVDAISEEIEKLKNCKPANRTAQMKRVAGTLLILKKRAECYSRLQNGDSQPFGEASGTYHCEAYISALLALWGRPGSVNTFEELLRSSSVQGISRIRDVLEKIKGCNCAIGVSKRCCPVCSFLLHLLNKHCGTNFVVSDVHTNITSCVLPEWLPGKIVHMMCLEFSSRLREELRKLEDTMKLRSRARTSDTTRRSVESTRSVGEEHPAKDTLVATVTEVRRPD